ncbi:MAG: KH domain-containing protein [Anaerolineae bacterium]|nr:KH domain-containing protein [Anaerolineae bacterium]MCK6577134.1 KH domain-containing protein [Anaerolineae bacterium]NUQ02359.1 KH domain-containing protein [Anaerolineae bacterium]
MEGMVEYVAKSLVDDPTAVRVRRRETASSLIIELRVGSDDMGRMIGRGGRVANALRTLLRAAETPRSKRVILKIL